MSISPQKNKVLAIIPARAGSKGIPNKNIKFFLGRPLIAYAIEQALACKFIDRIMVDTDSQKIADISRKYGAEVPWLRPRRLAGDSSQIIDSIIYNLKKLKKEKRYEPGYVAILQTTSPLREVVDIEDCWKDMQAGGATTVLTVCPTQSRFYCLDKDNKIKLANVSERQSTNRQAWRPIYLLNGYFYIIKTAALLKEKRIITKNTRAIICDAWRSVELDTSAEWVMAELLYKNKKRIKAQVKNFKYIF